jgi:hypothetical protein
LARLSASENNQNELQPKAFTEKELNRFLETIPGKGQTPPKPAVKSPTGSPRQQQ